MVKKVGNYDLDKKIGEGNYGIVYLGKNSQTQEVIAGKSIPMKNPNTKLLKQMDTEIRVLKSSECPYIIKLHDVLKTQNNIYLIMEYCEGGDLENYVKNKGKVEENIAKRWLSQLVETFIYLQEKGIMHRDIKLANILLTNKDDTVADIRVADFGFARFLNENSFAATQLGTPLFMAPEIFNNEQYSFKADVWSLGVLAYEILTGSPVFCCRTLAQLKKLQRESINFPEHLSESATSLINNMLNYNHLERPSFQQLRSHVFFKEIYNLPDIPHESIAASPEIHMYDPEEDQYELCDNESPEEIYPINDKDDEPQVKIDPQFGELATKTMELDCKVDHIADMMKLYYKTQNKVIAGAILKHCNQKIQSLYKLAGDIASEYSLTRSKDILFSELYEKIQGMLFETSDLVEKNNSEDLTLVFSAIEIEARANNDTLDRVKKSLNLLEVAIEIPECPESLKQLQFELLSTFKDLLRRGYY
jgi:serine/threonine protein kinase